MRTTARLVRDYEGPPILSFGFRLFFLLAGIWAAVTMPFWLASLFVRSDPLNAAITREWHVHEMLFGYGSAVIAGYLIVAGANWTGRYPVAGRPVALLGAIWAAGRVAMLLGGTGSAAAALIDGAFLVIFGGALWREQVAARNGRNLIPCLVVTGLAAANIAFHAQGVLPAAGPVSERCAIGGLALLIAVIGGRLVPSFTSNWLASSRLTARPAPHNSFDLGGVAITAAAILCWIILPAANASGLLLLLAGLASLTRLLRWKGWLAWREPLVWILHLGFAWLALGLTLLGASVLVPEAIPQTSAVHALMVGSVGVMTIAVMTRTTLSHTGRPRIADAETIAIYLLINLAAASRVASPFLIEVHLELLTVSATAWTLAFGLFVAAYGPKLCRPFHRRP